MINPTNAEIEAEIRRAAAERGINPDIAVRIWSAEGRGGNASEGWQSKLYRNGQREDSWGPFQLYSKGLGASAPFDIRNAANWKQNISFALDDAAKNQSWAPWYGRGPAGVGVNEGFGGASIQSASFTPRTGPATPYEDTTNPSAMNPIVAQASGQDPQAARNLALQQYTREGGTGGLGAGTAGAFRTVPTDNPSESLIDIIKKKLQEPKVHNPLSIFGSLFK